jgi:hypothetical protein
VTLTRNSCRNRQTLPHIASTSLLSSLLIFHISGKLCGELFHFFFDVFSSCVTKDLLFTNDGNPDYINGQLNVTKISRMADLIFGFLASSDIPYLDIRLETDEKKWALLDFTPLSDSELDDWSKLAEPADTEKAIIRLIEERSSLTEELDQTRRKLEEVLVPQCVTNLVYLLIHSGNGCN